MDKRNIVIAVIIVATALVLLSWPRGTPPAPPIPPTGQDAPVPEAVIETAPVDELPVATIDLDEESGSEDCEAEAGCDG